jgi:hypothetical protein
MVDMALKNMKTASKLPFISLLIMALFAAFGCSPPISKIDEIISDQVSPTGAYVATIYHLNAGATAAYSTIVSVRRIAQKGNLQMGIVFVASGKQAIQAQWTNETTLFLSYNIEQNKIFKKDKKVESISIVYRQD